MSVACRKAVTYLAENSGIIAVMAEQEIMTGDPDYALTRIKETVYDVSKGANPRHVRMRTTPPRRTAYRPLLAAAGNKSYNVTNPQTGVLTEVSGDKTGAACSLPAETLQYGYDVKQRCLKGKAIEAGPWCILELIEKEAFKPLLARLWRDMPRYMKEDFGRQLLMDVVELSTRKFSQGLGFPMSENVAYFPQVPTGGPSVGFIRKIETLLKSEGWSKGSGTEKFNGRPMIQIRMSREAIEWAIKQRKDEMGLTLDSRLYMDDGTWGKTVVYEGIQFIEADMPTRGYVVQVGVAAYEFIEIDPFLVIEAEQEGFWTTPNPEFYQSHVTVNGERHRVLEIGHIIHPTAMERQSLGALPAVQGKTFRKKFSFEVEPIPDYELADRGCNKDGFFFGYRSTHAYAPMAMNPELMTAYLYLAPTNEYEDVDPWSDIAEPDEQAVTLAALAPQRVSDCAVCDAAEAELVLDATNPTCSDPNPTNGVGVMSFRQIAYDVEEAAGNLTLVIERTGGSSGAASCVCTLTEGTATNAENWTTPSGFAGAGPFTKTISWSDGESGPKTVVVPIVEAAGDDDGKQFTGSLGTASGATISGTKGTTTVTILDADNA